MHEIDNLVVHFNQDSAFILNLSLGVIMFSVALGLTLSDFKRVITQPKTVFIGLFSQFLVLPFLTFILVMIVKPVPSIALGMFMVAACPGGNVSNFMSMVAKANVALSVSLSAIATTLAIVLTPLNFTFWASLYGPTESLLSDINISTLEMIKTVCIIMGLPLIAGMWVRQNYAKFTSKIDRGMRIVSLLIFMVIVIIALAMNFDAFWNNLIYVLLIVVIHNAVAMFSGYGLGRLFGLSTPDKKSLSIETGIQNSGLGLLLIFTFFGGLGGMALVAAWWGIWHLISGLGIAYYWSKS